VVGGYNSDTSLRVFVPQSDSVCQAALPDIIEHLEDPRKLGYVGYTSYTKRTLCSDSSVISVHGRQAPKEHRHEEPTCIRSCSSLCVTSGASNFPFTVNFRLCPEAEVLPGGRSSLRLHDSKRYAARMDGRDPQVRAQSRTLHALLDKLDKFFSNQQAVVVFAEVYRRADLTILRLVGLEPSISWYDTRRSSPR
jgi:hypothetical protein